MKRTTQEEMKKLIDDFVANGGSVDDIKAQDEAKYRKMKDWVVYDENGKKLSLEEKFSLIGYERKSKKVSSVIEEMTKKISAFIDAGGKLADLKREDELYKYVHGVRLRDKDGKLFSMQEKFLLAGYDRSPVYSQDIKQSLIDEVEAYLAIGGSFHIKRKDLPFYERLHTYAQCLKREMRIEGELSSQEVMRSLGYKNYSDTFYLYHELDELKKFRDKRGFVDAYKKDEKLKAKINELSHKINIPIAVLVGVFADENLERYSLSSDYFGYVQNELKTYIKHYGDLKGLKSDRNRYAKLLFLKSRIATELGEKVSVEELVELLGFVGIEGDFKSPRKEDKSKVIDLAKFCQEVKRNNGGVLRKEDIPKGVYSIILQKSLKHGITTKAYLKSFDVDYVDGRDVPRLNRFLIKNYPYMSEMREMRDKLLRGTDKLCEEELFEKRLEVCVQVYDEFKDKIVGAFYLKENAFEESDTGFLNSQKYEQVLANPVKRGKDLTCEQ